MKKTIKDFKLEGKKVIIRCDFNVPLKDGKILDDTRIVKSLKTIKYALDNNAKVILLSHLGRVKEEDDKAKNSLKVVATKLQELLNKKVEFINETRGSKIEDAINLMKDKDIILLENTRFEDLDGKKESNCDLELAKYWASLGDIFINDAFGTLHRAHASNVGICKYLDNGIGLLVLDEIEKLEILKEDIHPFVIITGGAKVSDKIALLEELLPKCDKLLVGGGMAFTFLKADGYDIGNSLCDNEKLDYCSELLKKYQDKIILPVDVKCNTEFKDTKGVDKTIDSLDVEDMGLDIGNMTVNLFKKYLEDAKVVFFNGPLGVYEFANYKIGTEEVLTFLTTISAKTIIGGGDVVAATTSLNLEDKFYHISTGGGATLEYIEGKTLKGLEAIEDYD